MLREVLDVNLAETAEANVHCHISSVDALDFHALHKLAGKVEARHGSSHRALFLCKIGLEIVKILGLFLAQSLKVVGQRRNTQREECLLELVVGAIVEETQCAAARGGVVDNLGNHRVVLAKVELVADTYFTCGVDKHVPQAELFVELAQKEYFDFGVCLLFVTIKTRGKNLAVVEDEEVFLVEIVNHVFKQTVLNLATFAVNNHQARLVAARHRMQSNAFGREPVLELRKFHVSHFSNAFIFYTSVNFSLNHAGKSSGFIHSSILRSPTRVRVRRVR